MPKREYKTKPKHVQFISQTKDIFMNLFSSLFHSLSHKHVHTHTRTLTILIIDSVNKFIGKWKIAYCWLAHSYHRQICPERNFLKRIFKILYRDGNLFMCLGGLWSVQHNCQMKIASRKLFRPNEKTRKRFEKLEETILEFHEFVNLVGNSTQRVNEST